MKYKNQKIILLFIFFICIVILFSCESTSPQTPKEGLKNVQKISHIPKNAPKTFLEVSYTQLIQPAFLKDFAGKFVKFNAGVIQ